MEKTIALKFLELNTPDGKILPSYLIEPPSSKGGVLVFHGYKSSKDYMVGLGLRIARKGFTVLLPDQRGAGESKEFFDSNIFLDLFTGLDYFKDFPVTCMVGYSLNGFSALFTDADAIIAISPPDMELIKNKSEELNIPFSKEKILEQFSFNRKSPKLILYGEKDHENFPEGAKKMAGELEKCELLEIPGAYHNDICYRKEVLELIPQWIEEKLLKR